MPQIPKISFIGFLADTMPLVGLPSNPSKCMPDEVVLILSVAVVIYVAHHLAYDIIMPANPPSWAEIPSWVVMTAFVVSYVAFRRAGGLRKTQGRWGSKLGKITALAIVFAVILILAATAYSCLVELDQFQGASPSGDASGEQTEPNSAEPGRHSLVIRSETTEDVWVIEVERKDDNWKVDVERDTAYLASATIIALATFGSLVSIRVFGNPETLKSRTWGFGMIFGGVVAVIIFQSLLMYGACCGNINATGFSCFFWWTVAGLIAIAYGSILLRDSELNNPSKID